MSNPFEGGSEGEMPPFLAGIFGKLIGPLSDEDRMKMDLANFESEVMTHQRLEVFKNLTQEQLEMLRITFRTMKGRTAAFWTGVVDGLILSRSDETHYCIAHHTVEDPAALADLPPTE